MRAEPIANSIARLEYLDTTTTVVEQWTRRWQERNEEHEGAPPASAPNDGVGGGIDDGRAANANKGPSTGNKGNGAETPGQGGKGNSKRRKTTNPGRANPGRGNKTKSNSTLLTALRLTYQSTLTSVQGLLKTIRTGERKAEWGYANTTEYLESLLQFHESLQNAVVKDEFAADFFANVDRKKEMQEQDFEFACGRVISEIEPILTNLKNEVDLIRDQHSRRMAKTIKRKDAK